MIREVQKESAWGQCAEKQAAVDAVQITQPSKPSSSKVTLLREFVKRVYMAMHPCTVKGSAHTVSPAIAAITSYVVLPVNK